jgi:hypothetical protein
LDLDELDVWAKEEFGGEPAPCEVCLLSASTSQGEPSPGEHGHRLTKLAREILDCVIDSALIHLDNGDSDYDLTLEILAERLRKSPAQIAPALERLAEDSLLRVEGSIAQPSRCRLYPTAQALRSLAAFEAMSEAELAGELERLYLTPIVT